MIARKMPHYDPASPFFDEFSNFYGKFMIEPLEKTTRKPKISFTEHKVSLMIMNITVFSFE
jgi:hypothetical protein